MFNGIQIAWKVRCRQQELERGAAAAARLAIARRSSNTQPLPRIPSLARRRPLKRTLFDGWLSLPKPTTAAG